MRTTSSMLAAALLSACAAATPTYVTKHGLRVFNNTGRAIPQEQIEQLVEALAPAVGPTAGLAGFDALLVGEWIDLSQMDGKSSRSDGYTNPIDRQLVAAVFSDCLYLSGLVHELAHAIHDSRVGVPDWTHDDKPFWEKVLARETELAAQCTPAQREADAAARGTPRAATPTPPATETDPPVAVPEESPPPDAPSEAPTPNASQVEPPASVAPAD